MLVAKGRLWVEIRSLKILIGDQISEEEKLACTLLMTSTDVCFT